MKKAKLLKHAPAPTPALTDKEVAVRKEKVVKESLSLDTGSVEEGPEESSLVATKPPPMSGDGDLVKVVFLKDAEAFEWIVTPLSNLGKGSKVAVRAYSFDQPSVVEALKEASTRGVDTSLVSDRSQSSGKTKQQLQVLKELKSSGTKVRLVAGLGVNQAYRGDGRTVRVGSKLQGLHRSKC